MAIIKESYRDNPLLKRCGIEEKFIREQAEEYVKCADDPVYFCKTYMKIVNVDEGLIPFRMWDFQEDMVHKFHDNRFTITKLPRQVGKALCVETPILTTNGFKKLNDINVGDIIYGPNGKPTNVTFITETMSNRPCYTVKFSNGDEIVADAEHLWSIDSANWSKKESRVMTTEEIIPFTKHSNRPYIKFTECLEYEEKQLPIDPYIFGLWLGDGTSSDGRFTCHKDDFEFYNQFLDVKSVYADKRSDNVLVLNINLYSTLRKESLLANKHIPSDYLFSSKEQRILLLQGLMDTDGSVRKHNGGCEFYQKSERIIDEFRTLLSSLGIKSTKNFKTIKETKYYIVNFTSTFDVFKLPRKLNIQKCHDHPKNKRLYIESITKIESTPVRCLQVDNVDHLFLAGTTLIPTHNTTTTVGYLLWATLFQESQSIAILANKGSLSRDILGKYQLAYENLPRWLQQGVVEWNKGNVELENGSKILSSSTSSSAIRGGAFNIVFLDEFAFVPSNMATEFFNSVYPVISSGKNTKIIIVSTPNGMNMFYKLWTDAKKGKNGYVTTEIHWSQVPGRTQAWKEETIRNTSEQQFRQEFETEFLGSSNTLVDGSKLQHLVYVDPISSLGKLNIFEAPIKGNEQETIKDHLYMITVDVSEGRNLDYSTFSVIDVSSTPYKQVARFRDNTISPILFPTIIYNAARLYNNAYILVEVNNNPQIAEILHNDMEYENVMKVMTGNKKAQTVCAGFGRGVQMGVKMSPLVKRMGCSNLKTLIESDKLVINDFDTISELTTFVAEGNSFSADGEANDDMVMSLVIFGWLTTQTYFKEIVMHDIRKQLQLEEYSQVDEEMLPVGELNDGLDAPFVIEDDDVWDTSSGPVYDNYFRSIRQ